MVCVVFSIMNDDIVRFQFITDLYLFLKEKNIFIFYLQVLIFF